jgi:hypothetical protein
MLSYILGVALGLGAVYLCASAALWLAARKPATTEASIAYSRGHVRVTAAAIAVLNYLTGFLLERPIRGWALVCSSLAILLLIMLMLKLPIGRSLFATTTFYITSGGFALGLRLLRSSLS